MAGIDKTFVNKKQYDQIINWVNNSLPFQLKERVPKIKCQSSDFENEASNVLWSSTKTQDEFLLTYCPLDFIQKRLIEQYGVKFKLQALYDNYKIEACEELDDAYLEWDENYLKPDQFTPEFDRGEIENRLRFNLILGKMIMLKNLIEKEFEPLVNI